MNDPTVSSLQRAAADSSFCIYCRRWKIVKQPGPASQTIRHSIPLYHQKNLERTAHEKRIAEVLNSYAPEYLLLAKHMRILTPAFVARYRNRIINIHHSFLPAFIGAKPYHQACERGVKIIGATRGRSSPRA